MSLPQVLMVLPVTQKGSLPYAVLTSQQGWLPSSGNDHRVTSSVFLNQESACRHLILFIASYKSQLPPCHSSWNWAAADDLCIIQRRHGDVLISVYGGQNPPTDATQEIAQQVRLVPVSESDVCPGYMHVWLLAL